MAVNSLQFHENYKIVHLAIKFRAGESWPLTYMFIQKTIELAYPGHVQERLQFKCIYTDILIYRSRIPSTQFSYVGFGKKPIFAA